MTPDRRPARILALQSLCQLDALGGAFLAQLDDFLADDDAPEAVQDYARTLVRVAWDRREEIDASIEAVAQNWELKRMATVDRNILRVAACESFAQSDVPVKVVIAEAVEIAKAFGAAESPAFINGILDALIKRRGSTDAAKDHASPAGVAKPAASN